MSDALDRLLAHCRETALLGATQALLSWDQETQMPPGGGERRAEQMALLARLAHERATDPRVGEWIAAAEHEVGRRGDDELMAMVRELRVDHQRATRLPPALVAELASVESRGQQAWATARAADDFPTFAPLLGEILRLQQQKADCLRRDGQSRWDALADLFEPGLCAADLDALFTPLRTRLAALRERLARGRDPGEAVQLRRVAPERQEAFVRAVLAAMGFDLQRGRLDRSAHPFCIRVGDDVRLTTRFAPDNVLDALGSTMHEGGHGLYEQGLPVARFGTPLAEAASLGIHESQSRLWENHVGRSAAFWQWCQPIARQHLGDEWHDEPSELFAAANRVAPSLIRVEADEATYDLHVMVRCELEQALLAGELAVSDLPARWNGLYRDWLGVTVPDDRRGCLQDVHWSCGLFGYFPTYTLGNLYAAQFAAAADRALGGLDRLVAIGDFAPLRDWLRQHVHRHGRRYRPADLCRLATGSELSHEPFLGYLEQKLTRAYRLG